MRRASFLCFVLFPCAIGVIPELSAQVFVDVSAATGVDVQHQIGRLCSAPPIGIGSAWADYDNDGDVDLFVTNQNGPNQMFRNDGDIDLDGLPDFSDQATALGLDLPLLDGLGTVFIDYDNDRDQDLFIGNWGGNNTLYENQLTESGTVSFVDVTATAGLADDGRVITAAWGDFDRDGHLDVYLVKHGECIEDVQSQDVLFRSNGDGSFTDVTSYLCGGDASCDQVLGLGFSAAWFDYDTDGDDDLYLANDNIDGIHYENVLWRNDGPDGLGGWLFTDVSAAAGADTDVNAMGLGIGDIDNDGDFDMAFSNNGPNKLLQNEGNGTFTDISAAAGIERETHVNGNSITWATVFFDYDNNQLLDLFIAAGYISIPVLEHPNAFFVNTGNNTFNDVSAVSGLDDGGRGRAASIADFDQDGFVDLFVGNYGEPALLYHNTADEVTDNHWLQIQLVGTLSNADAIGATIELTTPDGVTQKQMITSGPTHGGGDQRIAFFGLGSETSGSARVRWPSGIEKSFDLLAGDQRHLLMEPAIDLQLTFLGPGEIGVVNQFGLTGGVEDGAAIKLFADLDLSSEPLPACLGVDGDLLDPKEIATGVLDATGSVLLERVIPASASGRTVYFQAIQTDNCAASNVIEVTFD